MSDQRPKPEDGAFPDPDAPDPEPAKEPIPEKSGTSAPWLDPRPAFFDGTSAPLPPRHPHPEDDGDGNGEDDDSGWDRRPISFYPESVAPMPPGPPSDEPAHDPEEPAKTE
ncbi:hypothetical protein AA13595_0066 [Gluconacetobacter johannae DSM 13595]|nr:hypothetical protein AA13595_0066 [Gluconacetobacter johannae DSM 13595]